MLEGVEDEVEAEFERLGEVVAVRGDVAGDDLGEVGELVGEVAELPLARQLGVLAVLLLGDGGALRGGLEGDALLLEGEAVDVGVLDGVGLDRQFDREAGLAEAAEDGVVKPETRGPRGRARLHQPDGPAVTVERRPGRVCAAPHRRLPVDVGGRRLDLGEDDVDHLVEQHVLVRHVVVEGHRACAEFAGERAHRRYSLRGAAPARPRSSPPAPCSAAPGSRVIVRFWPCQRRSTAGRTTASYIVRVVSSYNVR